jgi:carbon storage regulator
MLVLGRNKSEVIMVGNDVRITIVDVRGDKVKVGIDAPETVKIHRLEIWEKIQRAERPGSEGQQ